MNGVALLTVEGSVEPLPASTCASDVLRAPIYKVKLSEGYLVAWSSSSFGELLVNDLASAAAGQVIRGDAVLCHPSSPPEWPAFLTAVCQRSTPKGRSKRGSQVHANSLQPSTPEQQPRPRAPPPHMPPARPIQQQQPVAAKGGQASNPHAMLAQLLNQRNHASVQSPYQSSQDTVASPTTNLAELPGGSAHPATARFQAPPIAAAAVRKRSSAARRYTPDLLAQPPPGAPEEQLFALLQPPPAVNWQDLCALTITTIVHHLQGVASVAAMAGSCQQWRAAILGDPHVLRDLPFRMDPRRPYRQASCDCCASMMHIPRRLLVRTYPQLLEKAARAGNVAAAVCIALLEEQQGRGGESAMRWWRRAAKGGHAGAQLRVGVGHYEGAGGLPRSSEESMTWLGRGLKQVLSSSWEGNQGASGSSPPAPSPLLDSPFLPPAPAPSSPAAAAAGSGSSDGPPAPPARCAHQALGAPDEGLLGRACLVMGYLHFDGESGPLCRMEAVKFFKMAVGRGDKEAEEVLGWIFNTGQYG